MPLCQVGKEYNPSTKRCVKKCKPGYSRGRSLKCKKTRAESKRSSSSSSKNRTKRSKSLSRRAKVNVLDDLALSNLLSKIEDVKWERESYAQELKDAYNRSVQNGTITSAERIHKKQLLDKELSDIQRHLDRTINDVKRAHGI